MYLVDTNIFLEVLLNQDKADECRQFLESNADHLFLTEFSFHSIGVILFREREFDLFERFCADIAPGECVLNLPFASYLKLKDIQSDFGLDFDDAIQLQTARDFDLQLVTMDRHFAKLPDANAHVMFL